jgi:hypothetical protein
LTGSYWSRQSKILAKDGGSLDYFGFDVSMHNNNAFIGAVEDDDFFGSAGNIYVDNIEQME